MLKEEEYLLTNQEILGGLKAALDRGQSLKQAMMSFYQAGYKKEEIEDAARAYLYLQKGNSEAQILKKNHLNESSKKEINKDEKEYNIKAGYASEEKDNKNKEVKKGLFGIKKKENVKPGYASEEKDNKNKEVKKGLFGIKKKDEKQFSGIDKTKAPSSMEKKEPEEKKKIVQKISSYESQKNEGEKLKSKALTTVLVVILVVLIIILGLIFLFKAEIVNFINGLFG